jgi:hypothetical protein
VSEPSDVSAFKSSLELAEADSKLHIMTKDTDLNADDQSQSLLEKQLLKGRRVVYLPLMPSLALRATRGGIDGDAYVGFRKASSIGAGLVYGFTPD